MGFHAPTCQVKELFILIMSAMLHSSVSPERSAERRLVVKHTFLEFVDNEHNPNGRAGRLRAFTDSALEPQFAPIGDRSLDRAADREETPSNPVRQDAWVPPADSSSPRVTDQSFAPQRKSAPLPSIRHDLDAYTEVDSTQPSLTNSPEPARTNTTLDLDSAVSTTGFLPPSQAAAAAAEQAHQVAGGQTHQVNRGAGAAVGLPGALGTPAPQAVMSGANSGAPPMMMNPARPQDFGQLMQFWMVMQASAAMGANNPAAGEPQPSAASGQSSGAPQAGPQQQAQQAGPQHQPQPVMEPKQQQQQPRRRNKEVPGWPAQPGPAQPRRRAAMNDGLAQSPQQLPGGMQHAVDATLQAQAQAMQFQWDVQAPQASTSRTQGAQPVHSQEVPVPSSRRSKTKAATDTLLSTAEASMPDSASAEDSNRLTTVMLRNLPNRYTREMLLQMLDSEGFEGRYTFVYLPIDFKTHSGLGYAFVDLVTPQDALRLRQQFEGFSRWLIQSEKVCSVGWSAPAQQGLHAHVDRYRNSPVMHFSVSDEWKPAVFSNGQRVPFPPPTRRLRAPNLRMLPQTKNVGDVLG